MSRTAKPRKQSLTLRIDKDILQKLQCEANEKKVTLNTLANNVLRDYVEWYSPARKVGIRFIFNDLFVRIIDKLEEQEIREIAKDYIAKNDFRNTLVLMAGKIQYEKIINFTEAWLRMSDFTYRIDLTESEIVIVIRHGTGKKWSELIAEIFRHIFEDLLQIKIKIDITDNQLLMVIENKGNI